MDDVTNGRGVDAWGRERGAASVRDEDGGFASSGVTNEAIEEAGARLEPFLHRHVAFLADRFPSGEIEAALESASNRSLLPRGVESILTQWSERVDGGIVNGLRDAVRGVARLGAELALDVWAKRFRLQLKVPVTALGRLRSGTATRALQVLNSLGRRFMKGLASVIRKALEEGGSLWQVMTAIRGYLNTSVAYISGAARDLAAGLLEFGAYVVSECLDIREKRWRTKNDDRVCPTCWDNMLRGAMPVELPFPSGDPHPPAHPGCRCSALYLAPDRENVLALTEEV
ncbi:MAG: hypothetical protein GY851_10230 [bacterium]|nr:hypothetical protein [bacterium]